MQTTVKTKRELRCELTEAERLDYGKTLGVAYVEKKKVEGEKKDLMDIYKNRLGGIEANIEDLSKKVSTGQEWREVDCEWVFGQPTKKHKQLVRMDTGEIIETADMTADDMQQWLGGDPDLERREERRANGRAVDVEEEKPPGLPAPDTDEEE